MAENTNGQAAETGKMVAFVSDFPNGLRVFQDISLIRLQSADYSLLIMEDYFPVLGRLSGKVELVSGDGLINLGKLRGFYIHRDNEFSLLIEEQLEAAQAPEGAEQ